jgi:hypothetical protein
VKFFEPTTTDSPPRFPQPPANSNTKTQSSSGANPHFAGFSWRRRPAGVFALRRFRKIAGGTPALQGTDE